MNQEFFKKFSDNLKKTLVTAEKISADQKVPMSTEHQLLALALVKNTLASEILGNYNISPEKIQVVSSFLRKDVKVLGISTDAKDAIQQAVQTASRYGHFNVDCEHLLMALLSNKNFNSYKTIERIGLKPEEIVEQIVNIFNSAYNPSAAKEEVEPANPMDETNEEGFFGPMRPLGTNTMDRAKKESALSIFSTNLTAAANSGKLDPVIGREEETERIIQILSRRTKNNPVLVGEPGVGKTAIVEGLAQRIVSGKVPHNIMGHEILSLDMGSLIAGTMYRGQFESRVKKILAEIKKKSNVIVFIDEIHTVVGAGSTEGSVDAANLLKPMLARGELRLIGSTTFDEYKKHIEKDAAFERRMQPVKIGEPTSAQCLKILQGIKTRYEVHHNVKFTPEALEAAVYFSKRYINDRFLPDKAIDLIDEAAAAKQIFSSDAVRLSLLKKKLRDILRQKDELISEERYKEATLLREKEIIAEKEIDKIQAEEKTRNKEIVDKDDIARVVSRWTGVPVSTMTLAEKKRFLDLEKRIRRQIIGQDEAVKFITEAIKRARVGISNPSRPEGVFIFLGPTGVGKTELAKVIAKEILGTEKALIKIDMSEFMERHNVSRLVGAPAGYIGYEEGGKLTEIVRKNPYSVILLDEIEKAHPEVFNILLQVMEDGELSDAKGRKVDFKNTIIIMTSNLGTNSLTKQAAIGFSKSDSLDENYQKLQENVVEAVEKHFKPEFINRIDQVIVFRPLDRNSIQKIAAIELSKLKLRLKEKKYFISYSKELVDYIAKRGFNPKLGARPIRKLIADKVETPLSEGILEENFIPNDKIEILVNNGKIVLRKT